MSGGIAREVGAGVGRVVLVERLLELDRSGVLTTAHARAGAELAGVHVRTVWRWLDAARSEGRTGPRSRSRFEIPDEAWEVLAASGGNVAALYRHLERTASDPVSVPSRETVYRAVKRDRAAGRVLPPRSVVRQVTAARQRRQALDDLGLTLPGQERTRAGERRDAPDGAGAVRQAASGDAAVGEGMPPGGRVVETTPVARVRAAVTGAAAMGGIVVVFGDPGRGKTVAVRAALVGQMAAQAAWVVAPVGCSVAQLRRAVFDALGVKGRFPHASARADEAITAALAGPRVLAVDEAQRLSGPCLEHLRSLWDHPGTRMALVLCGAGSDRTVRRVPSLASRVGDWEEVGRLGPEEVPAVMTAFHPLWEALGAADIAWADEHAARGDFRTWSTLTRHLHTALHGDRHAVADRSLLAGLLTRLAPSV